MEARLIEELLWQGESEQLDFKEEQYRFYEASDGEKGELLKDILAFANAWRQGDAYILIGVREVRGGRSEVVGIQEHLKDSDIQQFVSSKTQKPALFSYTAVPFEGVQIGVIRIPRQPRPVYLKKPFGSLRADTVYIRRVSATDVASPDEIARMGAEAARPEQPSLTMEFIDIETEKPLGNAVEIISDVVHTPAPDAIPLVHAGFFAFNALVNPEYLRELAVYIKDTSLLRPLRLGVSNPSGTVATNVRAELATLQKPALVMLDASDFPEGPPERDRLANLTVSPHLLQLRALGPPRPLISVRGKGDRWVIVVELERVQPKAYVRVPGKFYVGARQPMMAVLDGVGYADNLSDPIAISPSDGHQDSRALAQCGRADSCGGRDGPQAG